MNPEQEAEVRGLSTRLSRSQKTSTGMIACLTSVSVPLYTSGSGAVPVVTLEAGKEQK